MEEMIEGSGMSAEDFHDAYLSWIEVEATHVQLFKRATHVFTEALRVLEFRDVCLHAAASGATEDTLKHLGTIMNACMTSCSTVYECSCSELDQLTAIARSTGALTGAGWGGCSVSLVAEDNVDHFITTLRATYPAYKDLEGEALARSFSLRSPAAVHVYIISGNNEFEKEM